MDELNNLEIEYSITPYFNPVITKMRGLQYFYEACISVGDVVGKVARPYYIEFDYQDINGNHKHKVAEGFEAIICCHEIDHLDGIEFTDKAEDIRYDVDENKKIEIRNQYPREVVSKDSEFSQELIDERYRTAIKSDIS